MQGPEEHFNVYKAFNTAIAKVILACEMVFVL